MKQRNPIAVLLLPFVTFGIYSWYWLIKTKGELNSRGEDIPTAWIWLIPIVGTIWWLWKYSEAVDHVTNEKISGVLAFIMLYLLGFIGQAIIQDSYNKLTPVADVAGAPGYVPPLSPDNQPQPLSQPADQVANFAPASETTEDSTPPVDEAPVETVAEAPEAADEQPSDQPQQYS